MSFSPFLDRGLKSGHEEGGREGDRLSTDPDHRRLTSLPLHFPTLHSPLPQEEGTHLNLLSLRSSTFPLTVQGSGMSDRSVLGPLVYTMVKMEGPPVASERSRLTSDLQKDSVRGPRVRNYLSLRLPRVVRVLSFTVTPEVLHCWGPGRLNRKDYSSTPCYQGNLLWEGNGKSLLDRQGVVVGGRTIGICFRKKELFT